MKITFKNVGQGDSIILEWNRDGEKNVGIIDCNRYKGKNPVLEFIKDQKFKYIDFILLSHPHEDHFSGLLELLEYCDSNDVIINTFYHTYEHHSKYLDYVINADADKSLFQKIIRKIEFLYDHKKIIKEISIGLYNPIELNSEWTITALSPSPRENKEFIKRVNIYKENDEVRSSKAANLLSTILKITSRENHFVILTADSEIIAFERLIERNLEIFKGVLVLCQVPHHGSVHNHKMIFWNKFNKSIFCPAVISAGDHKKYNHPEESVVTDFSNNSFKISSTNHINGISDFKENIKAFNISLMLDDDSEIEELYKSDGDQIFKLNDSEVVYLS